MLIALSQINPIIGDLTYNRQKIVAQIEEAKRLGAQMVVFPEMALCGYPPDDLLLMPSFIEAMQQELSLIIEATQGITAIVGCVRENPGGKEKGLYNSAAVIVDRELMGFQGKVLLPDYDVFSERRYFEPASRMDVWGLLGMRVGITICEDIWHHAGVVEYASYARDPVEELVDQAPDVVINLSASPYYMGRLNIRLTVCQKTAQTLNCPVLLCNQVGGNDSLVFDGDSVFVDKEGDVVQMAKRFEEDLLLCDLKNEQPKLFVESESVINLFDALVLGVRDYFHKQGFQKACLGLSGGIDSAVVAAIAAEALGSENLLALGLPSCYTSEESKRDAKVLAQTLGIEYDELPIEKPLEGFLTLLAPKFKGRALDVTEENLQARVRGVILMAFSNKFGYLVLGTGNKSEMAVGYSTLYGDMCGGLGVLSDVTKAQVYLLAHHINAKREIIPHTIIEKPPSAELSSNQKDSDTLPPYPVLDIILQAYVEEHKSPEEIAQQNNLSLSLVKEIVRKIHLSEYKRQQAPPGLRVTKKSFSIGRRFPIVQHWNI